jgi:hypothetical protein
MPKRYQKGTIGKLSIGTKVTLKNGAVAIVQPTSGKRLQIVSGPKK